MHWLCSTVLIVIVLLDSSKAASAQTRWPYRGDKPFEPDRPFATEPGLVRQNSFSQESLRLQPLPQIPTRLLQEGESKPANGKENGKNGANGNGKEEEPPKHISDNSFLIEEAYNQEPGVIQHIFNWIHYWDHERGLTARDFNFAHTTEIPIFSQTHQFSFVIPFNHFFERPAGTQAEEEGGLGDILVNYRLQLLMEDECSCRPAVAPRFSLILPTGDRERSLGTGEIGYQFNLPISKQWEPFAFHFNAGVTYIPQVSIPFDDGTGSPERDLLSFNVGGSIIWLVSYEFNFMLEAVAFFNEGLDDLGARERTTEVIINPGFRWAVYTHDEVQWVLGLAAPIGLTKDAPDFGVFGYMSVEHNFLKKPENGEGK